MSLGIPAVVVPLLAKPVAILGAGVSGEGVASLLHALGAATAVYDAKGRDFAAVDPAAHALVVFSPGFAPEHPWLQRARAAGVECLGELDLASLFWRGRVVAVTGTNGKTTLTKFLTHALRAIGRDAQATGNIGHSFSRLVLERDGGSPAATAVCEVSSFQAETFRYFRADATLWTNFAEDHLERHPTLAAYFAAKWNLVARTASPRAVFVGSSVARFAESSGRPMRDVVRVPTEAAAGDPRLAGTVFAEYPQRENFLLAQAWWKAEQLPEAELLAAAHSFKLGAHRLTRVAEIAGVTYWNDSKATNFHAVEAALAGFKGPVVLIAGGKAKGGDLAGFVRRIAPRIEHAVLIGATSAELARQCVAVGLRHSCCGSLHDAVDRARQLARSGGHVLLSPGFASFDQFRNYEDRGEQFEQLVRELGAAATDKAPANAPSLR